MVFKLKTFKNTIVALLLFLTFLLPFLSMQNFSPASDEITHIPSGYSYLKTGEIKLNPQHPPLIKMMAAFPLLFLDIKFDAAGLKEANLSEWQFGRDFLADNDVDRVLFWARIPIVLLSVFLGLYIFRWGRDLFGYGAGLAGLAIYAFMPNIIAHAQLVTTDLGVAAFSFITLYYFWRLLGADLKDGRGKILTGIFLGLALASKFSAVFLLPIMLFLLVAYFWRRPGNVLQKTNSGLKIILPIFLLAYSVAWLSYILPSDPMFYYKGLKTVYADRNQNYSYYLNGVFDYEKRWHYFIWAFIIKTPVPFLAALSAAVFYMKKQNLKLLNRLFVFLPPAVFLFMASWKAHNIGVRYILPAYPFLILFVGGRLGSIKHYAVSIRGRKIFTACCLTLAIFTVWHIFSAINIYPDYLAYFNELIGGPKNGYKYLDDSNIEWGQDLKRLAEYQKENPGLKVLYSWSEFIDPERLYGIKNVIPLTRSGRWWDNPSGKYAVNTHALIRFKLASQRYEEEKLNWPDLYEPIGRIGQSFFIYDFK